jgi:NADH-quinone oxidoreductase subunit J
MNIVFLSLVIILAITSLSVKKSIASLISFALMMLVLGVYYIYLHEKLLGLFQIFVYAGGISVLMLFGITLIGTEFPKTSERPFGIVLAVAFFILISTLFLIQSHTLQTITAIAPVDNLFTNSFSDVVIIFALIGSSLLYGTIKMAKVLKPKRGKNV